jgi:hypothetical protein
MFMRIGSQKRVIVALAVALLGGCSDKPALDEQRLSESVSRQVAVSEDLTVFTLFALLNAAGYDLENRQQMHPLRRRIRTELARRLDPELKQRVREFYAAHQDNADPWAYSVVAKATAGPPTFAPSAEWEEIAKDNRFADLGDLHRLLPLFYSGADVAGLYDAVRPEYVAYIQAYETEIRRQVVAVLTYCRIREVGTLGAAPPGERSRAVVIPNLLDSYEHAFSFELGGRLVSVEGPQARIGYNPHEFVHAVTNPAVYSPATRAQEDRLRSLLDEANRALGGDSSLSSVEAFVDENLVRAVSLRYLAGGRRDREREERLFRAMDDEYRSGYVLERFFWEQLAAYETSAADLRTYYPTMISHLDAASELKRWRDARHAIAAR